MSEDTLPDMGKLEVCYRCAAAAANGADSIDGEGVELWRERYERAVDYFVGEPVMLWSLNDEGEPFFFSKAACDYCGDRLAGDRCEAVIQ